jgi:fatty-acid desaturase
MQSYLLFFYQLIAHIGLLALFIYGSAIHFILALIVYFLTGCFGMTMTYHRLLSHKSWNAPRWFEIVGTLLGTYGLTGSSIAWTAIHRRHHHKTDVEGDPHSPKIHGFVKVQWFSMFEEPNPKYAAHLLRDKFHVFLHKNYFFIHLCIFCFLLIIDPMLLVAMYLAPAAILWNMGSLINNLTHMFGYRNFETKDDSTNISLLGYIVWGEGWHNNHHANPNDSSFKENWWEFDLGGLFIKLLEKK